MELDSERCYQALKAHDARFDGVFFTGVRTTGIYCRPVCPARLPKFESCLFFRHAAAAERAGFRPCLRCRPELAPGRSPVEAASRLAAAAAARIEAGALNDGSLEDLACSLEVSSRQLRRVVESELGVTPIELAQTQRLLLAKRLLTESTLSMADVAFASGFSSVRRFNALFRERYGLNPFAIRRTAGANTGGESIRLKLVYRPPLAWEAMLAFLAARATVGVEVVADGRYGRTLAVGERRGWITAEPFPGASALRVEIAASLLPVLPRVLAKLRGFFDLDADPAAIATHLGADPRLGPLVEREPGLRVPGAFDGFDLGLRAILGQQVSVRGATTLAARFAEAFGEPIDTPIAGLTRLPASPERIAGACIDEIMALGVTTARARSIRALAVAVTRCGLKIEPGPSPETRIAQLQEVPGIGPWTAHYIGMRALRWPDAFPHDDLGIKKALCEPNPARVLEQAEAWRPWRAYAAMHLWDEYRVPRAEYRVLSSEF